MYLIVEVKVEREDAILWHDRKGREGDRSANRQSVLSNHYQIIIINIGFESEFDLGRSQQQIQLEAGKEDNN